VERVAGEVAVGRLQAGVEGLVVVAELLHHPGALFVEALLEMGQLLLVQAALGRLGFGFGLRFRRHYRVPPFRPSCRRSAMVTRRASMSTSRVTSASSSTVPSTSRRATVPPSTNPRTADPAATTSAPPPTPRPSPWPSPPGRTGSPRSSACRSGAVSCDTAAAARGVSLP